MVTKVALVHDALTVRGGAEEVLRAFHELFPQAPIYTPLYNREKFPELAKADVRPSHLNVWPYLRRHHQIAIPLFPYIIEQFDFSPYDLVLSDSTVAAKGAITRPEAVHISYCQTPMRWAWLPYIDRRASSSFSRRLAAHYLRLWDNVASARVDYWIANSQTTARRIKKFYRREAEVIYPPVYAVEEATPSDRDDNFFLTVGRLIPGNYKRTDVVIDGAIKAGVPLKIAGDGPLLAVLKRQARGERQIEFLGWVDDRTRNELYQRCRALIFAAEEDAGIVPIEAMAFGKPVIAFGRGGASETVIDKITGLHFPESTGESLAEAIKQFNQLSFDPRRIAAHARQYSPAKFRRAVLDYIKVILERDSRARP